jgi:hypothetical protein
MLAYTVDRQLSHHKLHIKFVKETAVDAGGPTQEAIRLFWTAFCQKYCEGNLQKIPKLDHR